MKKLTIVFLILFMAGFTFAQTQLPTAPVVIPPSPNAFAFQKYGDIPISAYTGIPSISVPIYEVKSGEVSVPISLSYHASGIKVSEEASKVGLGWVINAGGMISRNIVGKEDFSNYHTTNVPELPLHIVNDFGRAFNLQIGCEVILFGDTIVEYGQEVYDFEPDQYYYTLPNGQSGKFVLNRNKEAIVEKDELIEIKVLDNYANRWQIRTADGFTFEFDTYEFYNDTQSAFNKTAWYLTKIISPTGDVVTFKYTPPSTAYIRTVGSFNQSRTDAVMGYDAAENQPTGEGCTLAPEVNATVPGREYTRVQLDSIKFKEGCVKFTYSSREDILNDEKLDKIEVFAKASINPITYSQIKAIEFGYEYFQGTQDNVQGTPTAYESKRLKLKSLTDKSRSNKKGYNYKFEYFGEYDPIAPSKLSFGQDHWGYNNGKAGNVTLIPIFNIVRSSDIGRFYVGVMGDQRDPLPSAMNFFTLKRIWYPTGGFTDFEFEANDFDVENSFVEDHSYFNYNPDADGKTVPLTYSTAASGSYPATFAQAQQDGKVLDLTNAYSDSPTSTVTVKLDAFFKFPSTQSTCWPNNMTLSVELVREDGTVYSFADISYFMNAPTPPTASCAGGNGNYYGINYSNTYELQKAKYFWRVNIGGGTNLLSTVNGTFSFFQRKTGMDYGGGLRVKRVFDYESPNATPKVTRYDYHYFADKNGDGQQEEYSYGRRMTNPNYSYWQRSRKQYCVEIAYMPVCKEIVCESLTRISQSTIPLTSGAAVGYDQVTVYYGNNGENGKTTYVYHNLPDLILDFSQDTYLQNNISRVPRRPPANSSFPNAFNGMLKQQYDFRYIAPNQFDTVRAVSNIYVNDHSMANAVLWAVDRRMIPADPAFATTICQSIENYVYPAIRRTWVHPTTVVEKEFDQHDQTKKSVRTTNNFYENGYHFQLTRQEQYWDGKKIITQFKYPIDYQNVDCSAPVLAMKNLTFFSSPVIQKRIEEVIGSTQNVVYQEITDYQFFNGNTMILPKRSASYKLTGPQPTASIQNYVPSATLDTLKYRTNYILKYNADGNIISANKPNDYPTSYYWGYQGQQPIAEVKNAAPNQIFYTSFEDFGEGNSSESKTGARSKTLGYSKNLTGLTPGAYVLTYWSKTTGWSFQTIDVTVPGTTYPISLTGQVDEVRFYPKGALMTTYIYEPMVGIRQVVDPANTITNYEYDVFNRLRLIKDSDGNIVKQNSYNYKLK